MLANGADGRDGERALREPVEEMGFGTGGTGAGGRGGSWGSWGAGLSFLPAVSWGRVLGANDRIHVGVIGTGGRGTYHVGAITKMGEAENVRCTHVRDVDRKRLNNAVRIIGGGESSGAIEYERLIENKDGRDIGDTLFLMIDYPSEHTIVLASVMVNDAGLEEMIRGQDGTMRPAGNGWRFSEQGAWATEFRKANSDKVREKMVKNKEGKDTPDPAPGKAEFEIAAENRRGHTENFFDAIRGKAKLNCNIDLGCSTMVAIKMGVEAYRQKKVMTWDAEAEKVVA
jgi:hypothetical protein